MLRMFLMLDSFMRTRFKNHLGTRFHTWATKDRVSNDAPGRIGTRSRFLFCVPKYFFIMKPKRRAILVRLPESLVDRLDSVTYDLRMRSRSDYIRRSLERALEFSEAHEVPLLDDPDLQRALAR